MKNFIKSFRITIAFCIFFSVFYILVLWIFAQFAGRGENGNAETVTLNGKVECRTDVYVRRLLLGTSFKCW